LGQDANAEHASGLLIAFFDGTGQVRELRDLGGHGAEPGMPQTVSKQTRIAFSSPAST